jgi:hypothetical protein
MLDPARDAGRVRLPVGLGDHGGVVVDPDDRASVADERGQRHGVRARPAADVEQALARPDAHQLVGATLVAPKQFG